MTSFLKSVFIAIRPKTLSASIAPVLVGSAIAFNSSQFNLRIFFLTIFSAIFIQIGTNFANDVYDFINGADNDERVGPTRAVQANLISVDLMKYLTIIAFSLSIICGLPLVIKGGYPILLIGILSIISGYAYTGGPYPLGYNGWGDIFVFIFFGPIAVCGTFFLQLGYVSIESIISGIVMGCLSVTLLCINNIRDVDTDSNVGKRTIAVRFGVMFVKYLFISLFLICYLLLGYLSFNLNYINKNLYFLLLIITLPLCLKLNFDVFKLKLHSLNRLLSNVSVFIIIFSLLFILSILI
ncbi:MAG: 1,4-dihydroxy-2-naphthoate octaprenyltransferase [Candidatus Marinimicrobia bacterium]|nr:1,4-dihydroxy-2-naphthoate octaprenyltransferase [Candidatus Neomarinimicrobiota bacterium]|tara:strand:- start:5809 stop:6696 length:888 start_codon:yes stop_codon:yes gene_type:complete